MYPLSSLQQIKNENLHQELSELKNKIDELKRYHNFSEANELLEKSTGIMVNEKNVEAIAECNKKIDNLIKKLTRPVEEKINQLNFLKSLIEKYFEPSEVQALNGSLMIQEKKLKNDLEKDFVDPKEIENRLAQIDSISYKNFKKILGKLKQSLAEKSWDPKYEKYLASQLELIDLSEKKIKEKSAEISACFDTIKFVIESIAEFEANHGNFSNLIEDFNLKKECYHKLTHTLLNSNTLILCKALKPQIETLNKEFDDFDPRSKSLDYFKLDSFELGQKINELYQLNCVELQNQQNNFIKFIEDSKRNLTNYTEKLSLQKSKCAHNKSEQLKIITQKIDLLLNSEANMDENVSNREITPDKISDLKETFKNANSILSEYRGISLLRCFATFWGGGKVTSQLLVNNLEKQLTDLQSNIETLSASSNLLSSKGTFKSSIF